MTEPDQMTTEGSSLDGRAPGQAGRISGQTELGQRSGESVAWSMDTYSTLFVDRTSGGKLLESLKEKERTLAPLIGYNTKIVEKNGIKLDQLLVQRDPWKGWDCLKSDCVVCIEKPNMNLEVNCNKECLVYKAECMLCLRTIKEDDNGMSDQDVIQQIHDDNHAQVDVNCDDDVNSDVQQEHDNKGIVNIQDDLSDNGDTHTGEYDANRDVIDVRDVTHDVPMAVEYIGETCKSLYQRGS